MVIALNTDNAPPRFDGDVTMYYGLADKSRFRQQQGYHLRWLIFVNGMQTPPHGLLNNAQMLSGVIEGYVLGVYNQLGGVVANTIQGWIQRIRESRMFAGAVIGGGTYTLEIGIHELDFFGNYAINEGGRIFTHMSRMVNSVTGLDVHAPPPPSKVTITVTMPQVNVEDAIINALQFAWEALAFPDEIIQGTGEWLGLLLGHLLESGHTLVPVLSNLPEALRTAEILAEIRQKFNIPDLRVPLRDFVLAHLKDLIKLCYFHNPAVVRLFEFLDEAESWGRDKLVIFCHSQGNLIVSNALYALKALRSQTGQPFPPRPLTVFAVASPGVTWPDGTRLEVGTHGDDLVTWLSLGTSYQQQSDPNHGEYHRQAGGFPNSHTMESYLPDNKEAEGPRYGKLAQTLRITLGLPGNPKKTWKPPQFSPTAREWRGR